MSILKNISDIFETMGYEVAIAGLLSFIVTMLIIPFIIKMVRKKNLMDQPDHRKEHKIPTPTLGGIGIFVGMILPMLWAMTAYNTSIVFLFIALCMLFITGLRDDIKGMSPSKKFLIQAIAAFIVAAGGIKIETLSGLLGVFELPTTLQYLLTIFVLVGITNAVNLLDGIDGLAGGIGFITAIVFTMLFALSGKDGYVMLTVGLAGALLGFLRYNFNPAKIFMGDTGSLVIGFLMATLGVQYLNIAATGLKSEALIMIYGILILPVFDTLRVFGVRMIKRKSPFTADKNHIHHLLIKTGFNHKKSALIMYTVDILLIAIAVLLIYWQIGLMTSIVILTGSAVLLSELLTIKRALLFRTRIRTLLSNRVKKQADNTLLTRYR